MRENVEIDVREIFGILLKRAWIICLCAVICGALALVYTANFVTPLYRAQVTMYVNNNAANAETVTSSNLAVALQLVNTYVNIIQSDAVLEEVVEDTGLVLTPAQVRKMLTAESVNDTEMFAVQVTSPSPQMSVDIANSIADIAPAKISQIIEGSSAKVIDYAKLPDSRSYPSFTTNTVIGALVGGLLSALVFVVMHFSDTRIKNEEDLTKICQIPVLGEIPDFTHPAKEGDKKGRRKV